MIELIESNGQELEQEIKVILHKYFVERINCVNCFKYEDVIFRIMRIDKALKEIMEVISNDLN